MKSRGGFVRRTSLVVSAALLLVGWVGTPGRAAPASTRGVEFLGFIPPSPIGSYQEWQSGYVIGTDPDRHLIYYLYLVQGDLSFRLVTYRTTGSTVKWVRESIVDRGSLPTGFEPPPRMISRDTKRNRLLIAAPPDPFSPPNVIVFDLNLGKVVQTWQMPERLPGFDLQGLTYSPEDDRVYAVGEMILTTAMENTFGWRPQAVTTVTALNPISGDRIWAFPLTACQQPLNTFHKGALIARSVRSHAIYVPCAQTTTAQRNSGIAKVNVGAAGGVAQQGDIVNWTTEFFPISGAYRSLALITGIVGEAVYDPVADRIFLQSLSETTPGTWVFDGGLSAWVGFLYAANNSADQLAVNPETGHFYVSGAEGPLVATDGRGTPLPQGGAYPYKARRIVPDGRNRLLYTRWNLKEMGLSKDTTQYRWAVLRDDTPDASSIREPDYDELTQDIPETQDTDVTFAGGLTGFGSRLLLVGGWGGLLRTTPGFPISKDVPNAGTPSAVGGFGINDLGFGPGNRGIMFASVGSLDVRDSGSSASAQAVAPDSNTGDEWDTRPHTVAESCDKTTRRVAVDDDMHKASQTSGQPIECGGSANDALGAASAQLPAWPWQPTTCLDSGGSGVSPEPNDSKGGHAEVACSSSKDETSASTSFGPLRIAPVDTPITIASSTFEGKTYRDKDLGTVTDATARASGVRITTEQGTVSIAEVSEHVRAVAHGRPHTSTLEVTRRLSGIVVEQKGQAPLVKPVCENEGCASTLTAINRLLGESVRADMPKGERTATSKGAFAGYGKTPAQYFNDLATQDDDSKASPALQLSVFADSEKKSRVIVQFAAVQATSLYAIASAAADCPDCGAGDDGSGGDVGSGGGGTGGSTVDSIPPGSNTDSGSHRGSLRGSVGAVTAFLVRSPGQAFQFGLVLMLLAGAVAGLIRRRHVSTLLSEGEASQ